MNILSPTQAFNSPGNPSKVIRLLLDLVSSPPANNLTPWFFLLSNIIMHEKIDH